MQPYINPYLFQQSPYSNNYGNNALQNIPSVNPNQMYQQNIQGIQGLSGRCVNDFGEINVNEIVMDGRPSVFVKNDKSEIQVKSWDSSGKIVTTLYLPQIEQKVSQTNILSNDIQKSNFDPKTEVLEPLFERIEQLENKIDKISRTNTPSRSKKEVADE